MEEVYEKAIETGYSNAVFWDRDDITNEDIEEIKKWDKLILFSFFDSSLADKYISLIEKLTNLEIVVKAFIFIEPHLTFCRNSFFKSRNMCRHCTCTYCLMMNISAVIIRESSSRQTM